MGVSLGGLQCLVDEDDTSAIPYSPFESYHARYPHIAFVQLKDLIGIEEKESILSQCVYKVFNSTQNEWCVYMEPKLPEDVESLCNEIDALILLSNSLHIIKFRGLVISASPYLTKPTLP